MTQENKFKTTMLFRTNALSELQDYILFLFTSFLFLCEIFMNISLSFIWEESEQKVSS